MNQASHSNTAMNETNVAEADSANQLSRVDLNLVVAFDALARERSVTRAAQRLGVTQSAMSHSLRRLRDLLSDPLLVRGRGGMVFTPRAESLVVPLRSGLVTLGRALAQPSGFEPRTARRAFSIASPDLFDVLALPTLLERIRVEAPGVDIAIVPPSQRGVSNHLETGEVDVAIMPQIEGLGNELTETTPGLVRRTMLRDSFVCLIRADHPAICGRQRRAAHRSPLPLETYTSLTHALISQSGEGPALVDRLLEQQGLRRRIALRVPYFHSALAIIAQSDLILTAPRALTALITNDMPLIALPLPLPLPEHTVNLLWHERFSKDPGHVWLRKLVIETAATLNRRLRDSSFNERTLARSMRARRAKRR
jgi:DNA-binding transcriptional LysR family regulator